MFSKKALGGGDVRKSCGKVVDARKDSATRLKHLRIVLEHYDTEEAKAYFETNFSHVYFILYDNFIQAENNLRQRVHKAGREELEGALALLERVLCLLPELTGKRWQLHSLTRLFAKLLHSGNTQKLRAEAVRYFLLWYQALGDNAPGEVHRMFAALVPGLPEPHILPSGSPAAPKPFVLLANIPQEAAELNLTEIMQHPNFTVDNASSHKKVSPEHGTATGFMGKLASVSASIFHDTNVMNPVQQVEIQPLLPAGAHDKPADNETKFFLEILLDGMATSVTKLHWKDRCHTKAMRNFAFLLDKFKTYYLPYICPQFDHNNSLYKPNLALPVQHNILEDEFVWCRVTLIKWVAGYVHSAKKHGGDHSGQPSSVASAGSQRAGTPAPQPGPPHDDPDSSFAVSQPSDTSRASSHDSNTPHHSLDSGTPGPGEEMSAEGVVRDVLNCSREHVNFTLEVLRQAFLLPFAHSAAIRRVIALYKDWIQMNVSDIPPFLLENTYEHQLAQSASAASNVTLSDPALLPRRLRNDSYLGAIHKDNLMVRAGMQNLLQVFMTQAANVFLATQCPVAAPGAAGQQQLLEEQTDTCKRILNIYRYMVMHTAMDARTWEQLLVVLLQITSLVLTKVPPKRKQESLGGALAPAIFQTLIVTWIKANLNVAVRPELWQSFMDVLARLTHWEDLVKEWAKTMETLTRVLARHVYSLDLSEVNAATQGALEGRGRAGRRVATTVALITRPVPPAQPASAAHDTRTPGKSPKSGHDCRREPGARGGRRRGYGAGAARCRSDPHLSRRRAVAQHAQHAQHAPDGTDEELTREFSRPRRCYSLDSLRSPQNLWSPQHRDSGSGSRSPSPAPSSGLESSSIKDSPLQIDLASDGGNAEWSEGDGVGGQAADNADGSGVGVVMGGTARGWLGDVAGVLWRRMLAALGDPNRLKDPQQHAHVYHYLTHLNATLLKISANRTLNGNTEIHVPFNLVAGWCLEAEALPQTHRQGKLLALRLLCESTQAQGPGAPAACNNRLHLAHLHLYQRALHHGLTGEDRSVVDVLVKHAAPRYLSLALDGYSLLLLDFVHASTVVLNSSDVTPNCPRTEAVTFLGSLLSLPDGLMDAPVLQACPHQYNTVSCPDLKEHVLNIVVRVCRRERTGVARCAGACALAAHVCHLLATRTHAPRLPSYVTCLLQMLTMKNESIAKVVSDIILVLADYTDRIIEMYPGLAGKIVKWICACLAQLSNTSWRDSAKPLAGSLLLCLAEFCVRMGPARLAERPDGGKHTLLLTVFKVLYAVMRGASGSDIEGLMLPLDEDFDPHVQPDGQGPKAAHAHAHASSVDVKLWAQMICSQLVLFLGHWPLGSSCQLSSSVCEQQDSVPPLGAEPGAPAPVLAAAHVQLMRFSDTTLASLVELPALDMPGGGITPGLVSSERQVRVILRDLAGKACWDASALYSALYSDPRAGGRARSLPLAPVAPVPTADGVEWPRDDALSSLPPPHAPDRLPHHAAAPPDKHRLDHVLAYIGHTSPEVVCGRRLDEAGPSPLPPGSEDELIALVVAHRNAEHHYLAKLHQHQSAEVAAPSAETRTEAATPFQQCRLLLSQLGTLAPARRTQAQLMKRSDRLLRELRNLDAQRCRETHKVAVIYVGKGQETRNEILSNRCGSPAYEAFLAALAWEVELESHVGFSGGLQRGGGGGVSAPYLATLTLEALFHVATRMPAATPDAILNKTRHLGNDEVHVVWSEHWRAYRRDTLPTQFCDVLIALYPLPGGLLRCTLTRKPDVPMFGPLPDECVVRVSCAAALVRGAAFAGSRAVRSTMPLYQHAYSERARSLDAVVANHTQPATFERFVERVREPVPPVPPVPRGRLRALPARQARDYSAESERSGSRLAAALLDHPAPPTPQGSGGHPPSEHPHGVNPRPVERLGPFERPQHPPPLRPVPSSDRRRSITPPSSPPVPASRRNR